MRCIFLLILINILSFSLPSFAHSASPQWWQPLSTSSPNYAAASPPIEPSLAAPIQPRQNKKKPFLPRPSWDIWWLIGAVLGLGLFPFSLAGFLLGLGYGWAILCGVGLGFELAWWLSLLGLYITFKRNMSDADHFFEKHSLLLLMAGLILHGLGMLVLGLLAAGLWIWLGGALLALAAGAGLYLLWKQ